MNGFPEISDIFKGFNIIFIVVSIFTLLIFIFVIALIVSPKLRGKLMSQQVKSVKHMTDYAKEDLIDINTNLEDVAITSKKKTLDKHGENLESITTREADIQSRGIEKKVRAIKKGLSEESIYCKYCGSKIDADSIYCSKCGACL